MEVLITSHEVFLGIKCNSYIHVARNAKVTSAKMFLRKLLRNGRISEPYFQPTRTFMMKLF